MNATEMVVREIQGDSSLQMRQLLAERIREPRKSSHCHPDREVLPSDKASRNLLRIGIALSDLGYNPRDAWWGVNKKIREACGRLRCRVEDKKAARELVAPVGP